MAMENLRRFLLLFCITTTVFNTNNALPNGIAARPPMGWRSWQFVGAKVNGTQLRVAIDALAAPRRMPFSNKTRSLIELGYTDVAVDDGWACEKCTFQNPRQKSKCEMCGAQRPRLSRK